ncbi:MAG: DJ-1/PfpI family protein [Desulfobacterales bacterium]|nr:MAG: DJ-1/PfpI family protein [Desulfobacterales bacterium]
MELKGKKALIPVDWIDQEVVVDGKLITSRKPDDLPAFMRAVINTLK